MSDWGGAQGIVSTCEKTIHEIQYSQLELNYCSVFVNIYVTRALFCQPVSLTSNFEFYASNYSLVSTSEY